MRALRRAVKTIQTVFLVLKAEMEPGHRVTGSAILTGSGRVTGQCVRSVFGQFLSFNMHVYRGVVSTE